MRTIFLATLLLSCGWLWTQHWQFWFLVGAVACVAVFLVLSMLSYDDKNPGCAFVFFGMLFFVSLLVYFAGGVVAAWIVWNPVSAIVYGLVIVVGWMAMSNEITSKQPESPMP